MSDVKIKVGLIEAARIDVSFFGDFSNLEGNEREISLYANEFGKDEILFEPSNQECYFEINNILIGRQFHWQKEEQQKFRGSLLIKKISSRRLIAINIISVEDYLESVVSSEMNPNAPLEFIKAHAIISRSWVLAQIINKRETSSSLTEIIDRADERIIWYDHSGHIHYDVCADDHCQRYQGISKITNPTAIKAVKDTEGLVLTYNGKLCDSRFSKCCGGAFETFENCWEYRKKPYLMPGRDLGWPLPLPDLTHEKEAKNWILSKPAAFCNVSNEKILNQILNDFDLPTRDFYRWKIEYEQGELQKLIKEKTGVDFGSIIDILPIARGYSGRLWKIRIVGTLHSMIIGKELEIRRILSSTHLYSSAFIVEKIMKEKPNNHNLPDNPNLPDNTILKGKLNKIPSKFILHGAGWGHGVGLCQIGAAAMALKGYPYHQILSHYYPDSSLTNFDSIIVKPVCR